MPRSVHATKEYGKLRFHLSERMVEQGLNRNQIAQAIGSRFEVVDKWCSDGRERVCQDDFCKFSKFKYLSAEKSPNISCLHIS